MFMFGRYPDCINLEKNSAAVPFDKRMMKEVHFLL